MFWVTWRQHRAELLAAVVLLLALAVPLVWNGLALHAEYNTDGISSCVAEPDSRAGCERLVEAFADRHATWARRLLWAAFIPALAGVFVGAPLLARELEQGTWRLACTQGVSRTRWLITKLTLVGAAVAVLTATAAGLLSWWRAPIDDIYGRLHATSFVIAVPSLTAAAIFAFAVGVTAGAVLRRTIPAMAATLGIFLAVRLSLEEFARPHYLTPQVRIDEPGAATPHGTDWSVTNGWIDRAGRLIPEREQSAVLRQLADSDGSVERYLIDHGLRHYTEYHPDSQTWAFQAIESAIFLGLASAVLIMAISLIRRRT